MIDRKTHKKADAPSQKVVRLLFVISLSLLFLVGSSLGLACLCGRCLPTSFQNLNSSLKSAASKGSSSNNQRLCNFINGKVAKGVSFNEQIPSEKSLPTFTISNPCNNFFDGFQTSPTILQKVAILPAVDLYLKNLSIRC
jgi:hypothetical protein